MTFEQLHEILDNKKRKISKDELAQIIYELRQDCLNEIYSNEILTILQQQFYNGEANAFQICLDLMEHLEEKKNDEP